MKRLSGFFKKQLKASERATGIVISDRSMTYINKLLVSKANCNSKKVYLSDLYITAMQSERFSEKNQAFKELGDHATFVLGYLNRSLDSDVEKSYYRNMGVMAYSNISHLAPVYAEMAKNFDDNILIINYMSNIGKMPSPDYVNKLYSMWKRTRDKGLKDRLKRYGIIFCE